MIHDLKLYRENFDELESGSKIREYRLYDEKRKLINIGDTIRFVRLPNMDKYVYADVINIEIFNNWYDCYSKYFNDDFKDNYNNIDDVVNDTYNGYYTKEDSDKYGCCCLTLSNIRKCINK